MLSSLIAHTLEEQSVVTLLFLRRDCEENICFTLEAANNLSTQRTRNTARESSVAYRKPMWDENIHISNRISWRADSQLVFGLSTWPR